MHVSISKRSNEARVSDGHGVRLRPARMRSRLARARLTSGCENIRTYCIPPSRRPVMMSALSTPRVQEPHLWSSGCDAGSPLGYTTLVAVRKRAHSLTASAVQFRRRPSERVPWKYFKKKKLARRIVTQVINTCARRIVTQVINLGGLQIP